MICSQRSHARGQPHRTRHGRVHTLGGVALAARDGDGAVGGKWFCCVRKVGSWVGWRAGCCIGDDRMLSCDLGRPVLQLTRCDVVKWLQGKTGKNLIGDQRRLSCSWGASRACSSGKMRPASDRGSLGRGIGDRWWIEPDLFCWRTAASDEHSSIKGNMKPLLRPDRQGRLGSRGN